MADVLNAGANTNPSNTPAPEGHDAEMIAKVDQANTALAGELQQEQQQENLIGGKFKSQDDLLAAYQELERKYSQMRQQPEPSQDDAGEMTEEKASELVEKAGLDMDEMAAHYYENGSLSDAHYESLEKAGIPRAYVDQYIRGVEAEAEQYRQELMDEVGGAEAFATMAEWAKANLSRQELAEYNEAVDSGDMAVVRSAVMSLAYRYQREAGRDPKLVGGQTGGMGGGFESVAQLTEAMKDPRYATDPAYRKEIEQKLARSNIF